MVKEKSPSGEVDIKSFLKKIPKLAGVYRMYDQNDHLIYVGKAKNLYKRVNSYFQKKAHDAKTTLMVSRIKRIDFTITSSDYDAFILESNLIKKHKPHYNIFFKDDKSYPFIVISKDSFPRVFGFRGKVDKKNEYFGPYPSLSSVKDTLSLLQKLFPVRQCQNSYYRARTRPCLQYQIKRCLAPCVGYPTENEYQEQVQLLRKFLDGKLVDVLAQVSEKMQKASEIEEYELALKLRDQLMLLRRLQEQQAVESFKNVNIDIIGLALKDSQASISLLSVRHGSLVGDRNWLVKLSLSQSEKEIIEGFVAQYYSGLSQTSFYPNEIILPESSMVDASLIESISALAKHSITWLVRPKGIKKKWQNLAKINAQQKLKIESINLSQTREYLEALARWLNLDKTLKRVECVDISHFQGEATVASCVVFTEKGIDKSQYRRYNIEGIRSGDDYAAIRQVVRRRVESGIEKNNLPDVLIIDGGKGQLKQAEEVIFEHQLESQIKLISLAKGKERISGNESIFLHSDKPPQHLPEYDPAFLLLRRVRDESHNFAITGQRQKLSKKRKQSIVEEIPGVGPKRKKALLHYFGGWQELSKASVDELTKVKGISKAMAEKILSHIKR